MLLACRAEVFQTPPPAQSSLPEASPTTAFVPILPSQKPDIPLTLGAPTGETIRPLLGINAGPAPAGRAPINADLTNAYHQIGVTRIRTHDFYGPLDMAMMYPDRSRNPSDPRSFDFLASDAQWKSKYPSPGLGKR